jgi:hypothetical protein
MIKLVSYGQPDQAYLYLVESGLIPFELIVFAMGIFSVISKKNNNFKNPPSQLNFSPPFHH